ncbi:MAG: acyl-CoA carboxylase subunit beta, partial [Rhodothermales bacterium]|nr:acyl-CoA carboxylase subunit beta [Rhodothermales bacterium]
MPETDVSGALGTPAPTDAGAFQRRADAYQALLDRLRSRAEAVAQGGGPKRIEREHRRGKLTARERIAALLDDPEAFHELGRFAG